MKGRFPASLRLGFCVAPLVMACQCEDLLAHKRDDSPPPQLQVAGADERPAPLPYTPPPARIPAVPKPPTQIAQPAPIRPPPPSTPPRMPGEPLLRGITQPPPEQADSTPPPDAPAVRPHGPISPKSLLPTGMMHRPLSAFPMRPGVSPMPAPADGEPRPEEDRQEQE